MKIALVTPYENYLGGVESVNRILIDIFTQAGHEVKLISTDNCKVSVISKFMVKIVGLPYLSSKKFRGTQEEFDVVLANGEFGFGINHPKAINIFHGCSKGYRDHLKEFWSFRQYIGLTRGIYFQRLSARDKYVVCVSEFVKSILEGDGIKVNQVIPNCVSTTLFKPTQKDSNYKFLFVGSFNYYAKGFDILENLAEKGLNIDCLTSQKPPSKLGWIQGVSNSKMPEVYNMYKLLVFPSRFEGMAMAPLEAMACGLPIVMSNVGLGPGLKECIPEFVVDSYDPQEYFEKIRHIESDYEKYSRKAREYVKKNHSYENYKKLWLELVERIANA